MRIAKRAVWAVSALLLLFGTAASPAQAPQTQQTSPLQIATKALPDAFAGDPYEVQLNATGGAPPYEWSLDPQSKLPPGLTLSKKGLIAGTPKQPGEFTFTIQLRDQGPPSEWVQLAYKITIKAALAVVWWREPMVRGNQIVGTVLVWNNLDDSVDLTVIVVAVNETGKAFALGYQKFDLARKSKSEALSFGTQMNLPAGNYVVHVDAIGESVAKNRIYRARQQTPKALAVVAP